MDAREYEERKRQILSKTIRESLYPPTELEVKQIIESEDRVKDLELCTNAEVLFTGKETMEGFVSLVNMFISAMVITSSKPCLVNVDNSDQADSRIFYASSLMFKDTFTTLLSKKIPELKTINVVTSYSQLPNDDIDVRIANKLGNYTFAYMGLKPQIHFYT